jgi:hypothetical protein
VHVKVLEGNGLRSRLDDLRYIINRVKNNRCSEVSKERGDLQTGIVNITESLGTKNSDSWKKYHVLVGGGSAHPLKGAFDHSLNSEYFLL